MLLLIFAVFFIYISVRIIKSKQTSMLHFTLKRGYHMKKYQGSSVKMSGFITLIFGVYLVAEAISIFATGNPPIPGVNCLGAFIIVGIIVNVLLLFSESE